MTERERSRLVEDNLGLVYKILNKSSYQAAIRESLHYDNEDLLQEGSMALMRAAKTYDESCGVQFSSYAWEAIDNALKDFFRKEQTLRKGYGCETLSLNSFCGDDERLTLETTVPYEVDFDSGMNLSNVETAIRTIAKEGTDLSIYADIFLRMVIEGYSYDELCSFYGISIKKAYKGRERLLERIRAKKELFSQICGYVID